MFKNTLKKIALSAIFIICINCKLNAASSEGLVVTATRAAVNTLTLSSATLTYAINPATFDNSGSENESLGTITVTATKETSDSHGVTITQSDTYPATGGSNPTAGQWALFRGATASQFMLLLLQSNVATSATTTFTATSAQTIIKTSQATPAANLTTATTSTYSSQTLTLTFRVVDGPGIDLTPGSYVGNFTVAIGAAIS
jgi:hypothetical protein